MNLEPTVYSDGAQHSDSLAGAASIVVINGKKFKLLSHLGSLKSSEAELWAFIIGLSALRIVDPSIEKLKWISDSKSSQTALHSKNDNKHILEWKIVNQYLKNIDVSCEFKNRRIKDRYLNQCDKASRWAAKKMNLSRGVCSVYGKNTKPEAHWLDINLFKDGKLTSEIEQINSNLRSCLK